MTIIPINQETFGAKLRRLARNAAAYDPWNKPHMASIPPWQPGELCTYYNTRVLGGNVYVSISPLSTNSYGPGPTHTDGTLSVSDVTQWSFFGKNLVTTDPSVSLSAWAGSTSYSQAAQRTNGSNVYAIIYSRTQTFNVTGVTVTPTAGANYTNNGTGFRVVSASITAGSGTITCYGVSAPLSSGTLTKTKGTGDATITFGSTSAVTTSASSGGPTGTGAEIVDGGVVWTFMGPYLPNPYAGELPTVTYSTSSPSGTLPVYYRPYAGASLYATGVRVGAAGTGYAVGDVITLDNTGATVATGVQLTVTSITIGTGAITGVSVSRRGDYSVLPTSQPQTQSSTTGSGTGATFWMKWKFPGWGKLRGCSLAGNVVNNWGRLTTFQAVPGATPRSDCGAIEFYTDAPILAFQLSQLNSTQGCNVIIDGVRYAANALPNVSAVSNANYYTFDFSATSGRKKRHWRIEFTTYIYVPGVFIGVNDAIWAPDDQDAVNAVVVSDSIWATGGNYASYMLGNSIPHRLKHKLGWTSITNMSQGGTGYINAGGSPGTTTGPFGNRIQELIDGNYDIIMFAGSSNDGGANAASSYSVGSPTTVNTYSPHGLSTGDTITFSGCAGTGASLLNGVSLAVTVTSTTAFTLPVNSTGLTLTSANGVFVKTSTGRPPVVDAAAACFTAIRTGGSTAPIIVFGLWSASSYNTDKSETYLQQAIALAADPLSKTFWIPIYYDAFLPWITGTYNTNPTPYSGVSSQRTANQYVNSSDLFHSNDAGNGYGAERYANSIRDLVLPNLL